MDEDAKVRETDREIEYLRMRIKCNFGGDLNNRHLAQRIHELQQVKRSITHPESFRQPVKQYITEDVAKSRIAKAFGPTIRDKLLLLIEETP
jgi:hypothetical protein